MKVLLFMLIGIFLINCSSQNETNIVKKGCQYPYNDDENDLLKSVNEYRVSIGLNELNSNDCISIECKNHNTDMINTGNVSHSGFVERSDKIIKELSVTYVDENIAYGYNSSESILQAWLGSTKHKANVEGDFTQVGFSISVNSEGKKYCTMIFVK